MNSLGSLNSLASYSASLWCTQHSVDSLKTANISFHKASLPQAQGLEDVIRTVQALNLPRFPYYKIGRGEQVGEGETFWVEHGSLEGKAVAVKHLKVGLRKAGSPEFLRRVDSLLLELRTMHHGPLKSHPNILTLIGYGWNTDGESILPYMLVEYCANGNLREYLLENKPVVARCKELLIADVAAGVHALHTAGIIHGDIKLDNVLVFDSNERRIAPVAKMCDFGHSILLGVGAESRKTATYSGTIRYNAPEVFNQKTSPIARSDLRKCDIWAFGLLAWEVLLDGEFYLNTIPGLSVASSEESAQQKLEPGQVLKSALPSARVGSNDIQKAIFRNLFKKTLEVDPTLRVAELNSLPIMSKWRQTGTTGLSAQLALHTGASEWSYEIFRYEYSRETFWLHKEQIARDFQTFFATPTEEDDMRGSAAWQIGLCYALGFGVSNDWNKTEEHIVKAIELESVVAQKFGPMLLCRGADHSGEIYTSTVLGLLALDVVPYDKEVDRRRDIVMERIDSVNLDSTADLLPTLFGFANVGMKLTTEELASAAPRLDAAILNQDRDEIIAIHRRFNLNNLPSKKPPLIQGLRTRNLGIVQTLLECGVSPETKDGTGRNAYHWLFMLDKEALQCATHRSMRPKDSESLNKAATGALHVHPLWPLQLEGSPLTHAIAVGSYSAVDALLQLGAHPFSPAFNEDSQKVLLQEHWKAIHVAVKYHRPDILMLLLKQGLEPETPFAMPPALALCYSTIFERIAMHGMQSDKRLEEVIGLLGPPKTLQNATAEGMTAIVQALDCNDVQVASALLIRDKVLASKRCTTKVDDKDKEVYHYPVHHAAQLASRNDEPGALQMLELIIKHDPRALSRLDSYGRTPLHVATAGSSPRAAQFIASQLPSLLHTADDHGATPLHYCESIAVAELLVSLGMDVDALDHSGKSAMCYAVTKGLGHVVKALCNMKAKPNSGTGSSSNPLHLAIGNSMHDVVVSLISFGSDVNLQDNSGYTPLHVAAEGSPPRIIRLLLERKANVSILNNRGASALHIAVDFNNLAAIEIIAQHRPELILAPEKQMTAPTRRVGELKPRMAPLFIGAQHFNALAIQRMLPLVSKQELEKKDSNERNALHYAANIGSIDLVIGLLDKGLDINLRDKHWDTALTLAARSRTADENESRLELCQKLIQKGAKVDAENLAGESAWDVAFQNKQTDMLAYLLSHSYAACRNVTRAKLIRSRKGGVLTWLSSDQRESCAQALLDIALRERDSRLLTALRAAIPLQDFLDLRGAEVLEFTQLYDSPYVNDNQAPDHVRWMEWMKSNR